MHYTMLTHTLSKSSSPIASSRNHFSLSNNSGPALILNAQFDTLGNATNEQWRIKDEDFK